MKTQRSSNHKTYVYCKNCGEKFYGYYCNTCGQDAHTDKIDRHFVYHELQHALFHIDKGIVYTLKQLLSRPGHSIREFIEGKRVRHFKPIGFLLVMAGLYAFVNHFFETDLIIARGTGIEVADNSIERVNEFIKEHFAVFILLELPLIAYVYYLFFKKYRTAYLEQVVICCYISGLRTFISILILPLNHYWPVTGSVLDILVPLILFVWTYSQFYRDQRIVAVLLKATLGYLVFYILVVFVLSVVLTVLAS